MSTDHDAQLRKAAILVDSLDGHLAQSLLRQLGPGAAEGVRQAARRLGAVDVAERERIVQEFLAVVVSPVAAPPDGVEMDESLLTHLARAAEPEEEPPPSAPAHPAPFAFLQDVPTDALAACLAAEHPQTLSTVLAYLPAGRAAELLQRLPLGIQADVLRRVARHETAAPEIVAQIEQALQQTLTNHGQQATSPPMGVAAVAAILDASPQQERPVLLEQLQQADKNH